MCLIIPNILDMMLNGLDESYFQNEFAEAKRFVDYCHDMYWWMCKFVPIFAEQQNLTPFEFGIPQELTLEFSKELREDGLYYEDESHIELKWKPRAFRKMEKTILHELTHLMLVECLGYNPPEDHDTIFWEFMRRFKRFYNKWQKEKQK